MRRTYKVRRKYAKTKRVQTLMKMLKKRMVTMSMEGSNLIFHGGDGIRL